ETYSASEQATQVLPPGATGVGLQVPADERDEPARPLAGKRKVRRRGPDTRRGQPFANHVGDPCDAAQPGRPGTLAERIGPSRHEFAPRRRGIARSRSEERRVGTERTS